MTLQVLVQVTQFWKMFTPLCLDFSSFFFSRSFHLAITIIKSPGSYIEFESLYFSPIIVFHSSCHSNRNHFSLLAWQIFSFAVLVFSIFTIKYAGLVRFGNQRRWTMSKRIFNYTVPSEGKKSVLKLCLIIWFLSLPAKSNSFRFCFKAIFSSPPPY